MSASSRFPDDKDTEGISMTAAQPLVSIITPVYNGEKYLEETLLSVFSQTYKHWELIVIDDGSATDACAKICQKYSDKMKYLRQDNRGLSAARNRGIQEAKGEYIAFIDQDDIWLPQKLEKQVALFESLRSQGIKAGFVYTKMINIDGTGEEIGRSLFANSGNLYKDLTLGNMVGTPSSVMTLKNALDEAGAFDETIKSYSDWELWLRLSKKYQIHCLGEFLIKYRYADSALRKNIDLMASDVERIVEMIIERDEELSANSAAAKKLRCFHREEIKKAWKESARDRILLDGDGPAFRKTVSRAYGKYGWLRSFKLTAYYLLSFVSIPMCGALMKMRRSP